MAGISIDFVADVAKFIGKTKDITTELEKVSDSLDAMATDAERAGKQAVEGIEQVDATKVVSELREMAAEAKAAGSDMEVVFEAAAEEVEASVKDMGQAVEKNLDAAAKDAGTAAEKLEGKFKEAFDKVSGDAKKASEDVSTETKRGFKDAEGATSTFKDEARQNLSESVSSFRGDVEDIPQLLQDVLGGVSADLGAMGGLAAAGVAAAIGVTIAKLQEHADKVNEAKEAVGELAREIADADGNLADIDFGSRVRDWAFEVQDSRSWFEVWQKDAVSNLESVAKAAEDSGENLSTFWQAMASPDAAKSRDYLDDIKGRLGDVSAELDDALVSQGQMNGATAEQVQALTDEKNALQDLVTPLEEQVTEKEKAYEASVIMRAAEEGLSEATIKTRDAIAEQNAAIEENNTLKDESAKKAGDAFLAQGDYNLAVADATAKIAENNAVIADANTTEAERGRLMQENREAAIGVAEDTRAYAQTMADAGATQEEVNAILNGGAEAFRNAARDAGIADADIGGLVEQLGLMPGDVTTTVKVAVEGLTGVEALERTLNRIDGKSVTSYVATKQYGQGALNSGGTVPFGKRARKAASGTYVTGEGGDIEDRVPYMLSPGESVIDKQATDQLGGPGIIDILNNGQGVGGSGGGSGGFARIDPGDLDRLVAGIAREIRMASQGAGVAAYSAAITIADASLSGQAVIRR